VPRNVRVRKAPRRNEDLYREGDICVQPSYWEGLGLPLLECQAAGLPLITTDAPPMNEYQPLRAVTVGATELVSVGGQHPITAARSDPAALAAILDQLYQTDISEASEKARQFVEREHSWDQARRILEPRFRK
jgi:glycosyltransferase involved in cell wall biosynthesis